MVEVQRRWSRGGEKVKGGAGVLQEWWWRVASAEEVAQRTAGCCCKGDALVLQSSC